MNNLHIQFICIKRYNNNSSVTLFTIGIIVLEISAILNFLFFFVFTEAQNCVQSHVLKYTVSLEENDLITVVCAYKQNNSKVAYDVAPIFYKYLYRSFRFLLLLGVIQEIVLTIFRLTKSKYCIRYSFVWCKTKF